MMSEILPVTVVTTCYGRNRHLYNLLASLETGSVRPSEVIIVNDDAEQDKLDAFDLNIVKIPTTNANVSDSQSTGFDIGKNRNLGADKASFESLIFLDVDCVVSHTFIEGLCHKLYDYPASLLMAQPRYLTRPLTVEEGHLLSDRQANDDWLNKLSVLNPFRHNMIGEQNHHSQAVKLTDDYGAFWSLCFATQKSTFERIGGFDTDYIGYGAEDTDFAFMARKLGIALYLTNDVAYHQQHSVYRPPLNHLSSIVINANQFYKKWQHWAMSGWLKEFSDMGLIDWESHQTMPIEVSRLPSEQELASAYSPDAPFV